MGLRADSAFVEKVQALLSRDAEDIAGYRREFRANRCTQEACFHYPGPEGPEEGEARVLTAEDGPLLVLTFEEDVEELPTATPFVGRVWEGQVVSIGRSVRRGRGHEAGIETLPEYRRQGHALAALRGWTGEVLQQGAVPLYSAARENAASLALAEQAGLCPMRMGSIFGRDIRPKKPPERKLRGLLCLVLVTGIEPVRGETSQDFKSWASASSATPAGKMSMDGVLLLHPTYHTIESGFLSTCFPGFFWKRGNFWERARGRKIFEKLFQFLKSLPIIHRGITFSRCERKGHRRAGYCPQNTERNGHSL